MAISSLAEFDTRISSLALQLERSNRGARRNPAVQQARRTITKIRDVMRSKAGPSADDLVVFENAARVLIAKNAQLFDRLYDMLDFMESEHKRRTAAR